jgi:hypothetical protein
MCSRAKGVAARAGLDAALDRLDHAIDAGRVTGSDDYQRYDTRADVAGGPLRSLYSGVASLPVPDRFRALLGRLD